MKQLNGAAGKFAENQLKKFGWKEGEGIGKTQGIVNPIKASLKFDNSGLGFNAAEEFTVNWWDHLYNNTAKSIDSDQDKFELKKAEIEKSKNQTNVAMNRKSYFYSRFQKGTTLIGGQTEENEKKPPSDEVETIREVKEEKPDKKHKSEKLVSDEDLFKICGGRTAHKGARHGIKMNGKLSRLEEQEKMFLEKYAPKDETQREETLEKTKKKKEKRKTTSSEIDCNESGFENVNDSDLTKDLTEDCDLTKKKNKKKKKSIDE